MNPKLKLLLFLITLPLIIHGQENWRKVKTPNKTFILGFGPNYFGLNAKIGVFLGNNSVFGINSELHELLSSRREIGCFGRKYLNNNTISMFIQTGLAFGTFKEWDWDIDNETPGQPELIKSLKINGILGSEVRLTKNFSLEGELGIGKLLNANWWAPSVRGSLNYRFHK
jgi:hypothetical protein